jgi:hypothetical protein
VGGTEVSHKFRKGVTHVTGKLFKILSQTDLFPLPALLFRPVFLPA